MSNLCNDCGHELPNAVGIGAYCTNCGTPTPDEQARQRKHTSTPLSDAVTRFERAATELALEATYADQPELTTAAKKARGDVREAMRRATDVSQSTDGKRIGD